MSLASKIHALRKIKGLSVEELSEKASIPKGTLSKITAGITQNPSLETVRAIANALDCTLDDLSDLSISSSKMSEKGIRIGRAYDRAATPIKRTVEVALEPYMEVSEELAPKLPKAYEEDEAEEMIEMRRYLEPAAAGFGNYLSDDSYESVYYPASAVPVRADFTLPVSGDSMEPDFEDGDTVFVQACVEVENGEIGIFTVDGSSYIKKLEANPARRQARLVSLNPKYRDIILSEEMDVRTVGRVLGVAPRDEE